MHSYFKTTWFNMVSSLPNLDIYFLLNSVLNHSFDPHFVFENALAGIFGILKTYGSNLLFFYPNLKTENLFWKNQNYDNLPYIRFFHSHVFFHESEPRTVHKNYANQIFTISRSYWKYNSRLFKPLKWEGEKYLKLSLFMMKNVDKDTIYAIPWIWNNYRKLLSETQTFIDQKIMYRYNYQ